MQQANPINVRGIDHVVVRVVDLDAMIDFYCDVLGARLERLVSEFGLAQLRAGDALIDLLDAGDRAPDRDAPNMDHVCLRVEPWDDDAIRTHLQSHGVELAETGTRYGASGYGPSMYISDPEGNTVELKGTI